MNSILIVPFLFTFVSAQYFSNEVQCPPEGLYSAAHPTDCDTYYLCRNGTLTVEHCPNGLAYAVHGAVYQFCAYIWKVNCKGKKVPNPISTPGCPWQFGIFEETPATKCSITYAECSWGVPERKYCSPKGLAYDDRIKGCNWPDEMGCRGEDIIGFRCPPEDTHNRYYPYSRYYYSQNAIVTCVNNQPRLIHCGDNAYVDQNSLICIPYENNESN